MPGAKLEKCCTLQSESSKIQAAALQRRTPEITLINGTRILKHRVGDAVFGSRHSFQLRFEGVKRLAKGDEIEPAACSFSHAPRLERRRSLHCRCAAVGHLIAQGSEGAHIKLFGWRAARCPTTEEGHGEY